MVHPSESRPAHLPFVLGMAVLGISSSAVLIRAMETPTPIAIALWRTALSALIFLPALRRVSLRDLSWTAVAGVCLAGHFWLWFLSLEHTTVMHSTTLVALSPAWAGLLEWRFFRVRPPKRFWTGIALAITGAAVLGANADTGSTLSGNLLALFAGGLGAIYMVIGRHVRQRVRIGTYAAMVSLAAALTLLPAAMMTHTPLIGFSTTDMALLIACAVGPQILGHNGLNYALRWVAASTVSVLVLLEPVGATLLAGAFLGEWPGLSGVAAAALVVMGVMVSVTRSPD